MIKIFQVSLLVQAESIDRIKPIINRLVVQLEEVLTKFEIQSIEQYDEIDKCYRIICNFFTSKIIDYEAANHILYKMSDNWVWDECNSSAWSSNTNMKSKFVDENIIFVNSWFEDLDDLSN